MAGFSKTPLTKGIYFLIRIVSLFIGGGLSLCNTVPSATCSVLFSCSFIFRGGVGETEYLSSKMLFKLCSFLIKDPVDLETGSLISEILRSKFSNLECSHFRFKQATYRVLNPLLFWGVTPIQKSNFYGPTWLNASQLALICLLLSSGQGHRIGG